MSTLSKTQLKAMIKKYVQDFIHDFEIEQATGKCLNPYSYDDELKGYDWVLDEDHETLAERRHVKFMTPEADRAIESMGLALDKSSEDYHLLCYLLLKARIRGLEACKSRLEHKLQGHTINDILKDLDIEPTQMPAIESALQQDHPTSASIKLSEVVEAFWDDRSPTWKPRSLMDYETCKKNLLDYFKDIQVHELNYNKMKEYRDQLAGVKGKPLSVARINFYIGFAKAVCNFEMKTTGYLRVNPLEGLHLRDNRRKDELRDVFSLDDLSKLFIESKEYGQNKHRVPENFWIPLLALYTGCRMEELCQLYKDQVMNLDGIWCLNIEEKYPEQSVKTSEKRIIPLHPFLIDDLKFHHYAQSLPEGRLWLNLIRVRNRYGHGFGQWFSKFKKRSGIDSEKKVFHSFRHTIITHLKYKDVPDQFISELVGHSTRGEKGRYGKRFEPERLLLEALMKLDFHESLDFSHLKRSRWVSSTSEQR
jgi:integrase